MYKIMEIALGQHCSFEVYPSNIFGSFKDVMVDGFLSGAAAQASGLDIVAMHEQIYPTLPSGTVANNPNSYPWVRLRYANGDIVTLGVPWIRSETVVASTAQRFTFVFDDITMTDAERIAMALSASGFTPSSTITE